VELRGSNDGAAFAAAETRALRALAAVPEFALRGVPQLCASLRNLAYVRVVPEKEGTWELYGGRTFRMTVAGVETVWIELEEHWLGDRWCILTHELAHFFVGTADSCDEITDREVRNVCVHIDWEERGFYAAVARCMQGEE
jgi:hypothetical protein